MWVEGIDRTYRERAQGEFERSSVAKLAAWQNAPIELVRSFSA
jgi:hypothetical protein